MPGSLSGGGASVFSVISPQGQTADFIINLSIIQAVQIMSIQVRETGGNALTGGFRMGSSLGANDIVAGQALGANGIVVIKDADISSKMPSLIGSRIYCGAVTAWNGAVVNCTLIMGPTN